MAGESGATYVMDEMGVIDVVADVTDKPCSRRNKGIRLNDVHTQRRMERL